MSQKVSSYNKIPHEEPLMEGSRPLKNVRLNKTKIEHLLNIGVYMLLVLFLILRITETTGRV
jgi:hypothetical protein